MGLSNARRRVVAEMLRLVPSDTGDGRFEEITGDLYGGSGTTCGYLASYALLAAGCRDPRILNRNEPDFGATYTPGGNIAKLVSGAKAMDAWVPFENGTAEYGPAPGDVVYTNRGQDAAGRWLEHVFVFQSQITRDDGSIAWKSWDAGATNDRGEQCARERERSYEGGVLVRDGLRFPIVGFVDLDELPIAIDAGAPSPSLEQLDPAALPLLTAAALAALALYYLPEISRWMR